VVRGFRSIMVLLVLILMVCGVAYAHWTDRVRILGRAKMGYEDVRIIRYCYVKCCLCSRLESQLSQDRLVLYISWENIHPSCKLLVVILLKNTGSVPAMIEAPDININPQNMSGFFIVKYIFLGPFSRDIELPKYLESENLSSVKCIRRPPIQLDPGQRLVLAIFVHFRSCCKSCMEKNVVIEVTVNHKLWCRGGG